MLTGRASDFYFEKLANRALTINQLVTSTKTRFETEENQQLYLSEWQTTSLEKLIDSNPDKDPTQCLELLFDKLENLQKNLKEPSACVNR